MRLLGSRIKEIRGKRSQADFGSMLGVDRTTVGSWEIGRHEPDLEILCKIADIAAVSVDWLIGHTKTHSLADEKVYHDAIWRDVIHIAIEHRLPPQKVRALFVAAVALTTTKQEQ